MMFDLRFAAIAILGIYGLVACLERVPTLQFRGSRFFRPHFLTDVGWYLSAAAITIAFGPLLERLSDAIESLGIPTLASADLPLWGMVILAVALHDLGAFVCHVMLHRVGWLWRLHKVHHSSRVLDWLATTRAHVAEHLFRNIPTQAVLFAIGFSTEAVALALVVYAAFATIGHSNLRLDLGFLEPLFITPRLHRLHHVPATTEKNYGTVLSLWDRLGGSLVAAETNPEERLGVPGEEETYPQTWWQQLRQPLRGAPPADHRTSTSLVRP
ncbi:MAG: sterol desaturase family protein [Myxococcales bacterium]|nr:sterol desaturase family protein [Myxococcales bacterium]